MDSFNFGNLQAEKANAIMMKQRHLRNMTNLFRLIEVCVALVLISRISVQIPGAVKNSGDYFRGFSVFMVSPRFVFVIGNIIIITLFVQSGQFSSDNSKSKAGEPDLYQKFVEKTTENQKINQEKQSTRTEDEKQSNRTESEESNKYPLKQSTRRTEHEKQRMRTEESAKKDRSEGMNVKMYEEKQSAKTGERRCESERVRDFQSEEPRSMLRRSETEKIRGSCGSYPEDDMSNDEFRRAVEAFIARQQRLRKKEEYFVISNP